jgi:hypothetical protein
VRSKLFENLGKQKVLRSYFHPKTRKSGALWGPRYSQAEESACSFTDLRMTNRSGGEGEYPTPVFEIESAEMGCDEIMPKTFGGIFSMLNI